MPPSSAALSSPSFLLPLRRHHLSYCLPIPSHPLPFIRHSQRRHRLTVPLPHSLPPPSVSTAPVEQSASPELAYSDEASRLRSLMARLQKARTVAAKIRILDSDPRVREWGRSAGAGRVLSGLGELEAFLLKCVVAAGQGHVVGWEGEGQGRAEMGRSALKSALYALADMVEKWSLDGEEKGVERGDREVLKGLLKTLDEVERFYDCVGGIIGYQIMVLDHLSRSVSEIHYLSHQLDKSLKYQFKEFHVPTGLNLYEDKESAAQAALWGIAGLPKMGEIYPLGGAGDRLGLVDSDTGECLPAAMLPYCGRTLLEGLIRDLQAREFLHFKIYGKQCITPVAIMTSLAKKNNAHITELCEKFQWFGRGKLNFQFFEQPLVPVVAAEDGQWLISKPFSPVCKPGGHGAIWKLAHDKGIFKWFYNHGRKGATVRQVSNVVAATDVTLLALAGIGLQNKKKLGFASCRRSSGATEGINVLIEKKNIHGQWEYGLTCIEYTEFEKYGIQNASTSSHGMDVEFPANTNILYVDLPSAEKVGACRTAMCLPGMVLNLKKPIQYIDQYGIQHSVSGGRLECTMQNIAESFINTYSFKGYEGIEDVLDTFMVFNERKRVTSSAKRRRRPKDKSLHQTPDGSLLDVLRNSYDLLSYCSVKIPQIEDDSKYFHSGPPFLIFLHPALGPLWEITRQKLNGGSVSEGSELQIEVAEFLWRDVQLDGSLIAIAENVMGSIKAHKIGDPILHYGYRCGRCKLQNIKVFNKGIDWKSPDNVYWKHDVRRFEALKIILHGNAEFVAENVVLKGNHVFEVPDGHRMNIEPGNSCSDVLVKLEPIGEGMMDCGSWFWRYDVEGAHIKLKLVES